MYRRVLHSVYGLHTDINNTYHPESYINSHSASHFLDKASF